MAPAWWLGGFPILFDVAFALDVRREGDLSCTTRENRMPQKLTCQAKLASQCSPPMGPFWKCPKCGALMCNNCKASRSSNQCPVCKKPIVPVKVQ